MTECISNFRNRARFLFTAVVMFVLLSFKVQSQTLAATEQTLEQTSKTAAKVPQFTPLYIPSHQQDPRAVYVIKLLEHALSYQSKPYLLLPKPAGAPEARDLVMLAENKYLNIAWTMTSAKIEEEFIAIKVPIFKGLFGWRISLISDDNQDVLQGVTTLSQLQGFNAGMFHTWLDGKILRHNKLPVTPGTDYAGLFKMLALKRFDYFPRSVIEVWNEYNYHKQLGIAVEPHMLLYYPTAMYYIVNKNNTALAQQIESGLLQSIEDGSFDMLFHHFNQGAINKITESKRNIIRIENPFLPKSAQLNNRKLWYEPPFAN